MVETARGRLWRGFVFVGVRDETLIDLGFSGAVVGCEGGCVVYVTGQLVLFKELGDRSSEDITLADAFEAGYALDCVYH